LFFHGPDDQRGQSLTRLIQKNQGWIRHQDPGGFNNLQDMKTIFKFDRLHRSIRRDAEERAGKYFNSDIRDEPQERQSGRGSQGVGIVKMVENYDILYFFLD
jgi:hypothetical protein